MGDYWQQAFQRIRELCLPFQRYLPFIASALTLVAGFCKSRPLRYLCESVAIVLFLLIVADLARSFLDKGLNQPPHWASYQGPPKNIPVSSFQILLTVVLALMYAGMIFAGLHTCSFSPL